MVAVDSFLLQTPRVPATSGTVSQLPYNPLHEQPSFCQVSLIGSDSHSF